LKYIHTFSTIYYVPMLALCQTIHKILLLLLLLLVRDCPYITNQPPCHPLSWLNSKSRLRTTGLWGSPGGVQWSLDLHQRAYGCESPSPRGHSDCVTTYYLPIILLNLVF